MAFAPFAPAAPVAPAGIPGDVECLLPAGADSLSAVSFSPAPTASGGQLLAATSWDGAVRIWEVSKNPATGAATAAVGRMEHRAAGATPILDGVWKEDSSNFFFAPADNTVMRWDLASNTAVKVGEHGAPIRHCFWLKDQQSLVTGGWDRQICVWDCRSPAPTVKIALDERIWAMDVRPRPEGIWVVAATASKKLHMYNLLAPAAPYRVMDNPLTHQTRCIKIFHDGRSFAIGTIEGRVAIRYIDAATDMAQEGPAGREKPKYSFSFRCHRHDSFIYPVNCIDTHPREGYHDVFATAGSDGCFVFWHKTKKLKFKEYETFKKMHTISAAGWNSTGDMYAYSFGYDWHRGVEGAAGAPPTKLFVHTMTHEDMHGPPAAPGGR